MRTIQFLDIPGAPKVNVVPDVSFAYYNKELAAGAVDYVYHGIDAIGFPSLPGSPIWIIGSRPIFSWAIKGTAQAHPGFSLKIGLSYNGTAVHDWHTFAMLPGETPNIIEGLNVPGWGCRFMFVNSSPFTAVTIEAVIKQQGFE